MDSIEPIFPLDRIYLCGIFGRKMSLDLASGRRVKISEEAWGLVQQVKEGTKPRTALSDAACGAANELRILLEAGRFGPDEAAILAEDFVPTGVNSVLFNLTHNCNLACKYCIMCMPDLKEGYKNQAKTVDKGLICGVVDFIHSVGLPGTNLSFFGGEPLLAFDRLKETVEYAEAKYPGWFNFNVITNGTLLRKEMCEFFKKHKVSFLFSIDGDQPENDSLRVYKNGRGSVFRDAWKNIRHLKEKYPKIHYKVNVTYFRQTTDVLKAFRKFLALGVGNTRYERGLATKDSPYRVNLADLGPLKEAFSGMAREYRDHLLHGGRHLVDNFITPMRKIAKQTPRLRGCNMGIDYLTVAADGSLYPCHKLVGHKDHCVGHVLTSMDDTRYRGLWKKSVVVREPCKTCWARFLCGGCCVSDNFHESGSFLTPVEENCELAKHLIGLSLWLFEELEDKDPVILKDLLGPDYLLETDVPVAAQGSDPGKRVKNIKSGGVYELNDLARRILDGCNGQNSVGDIARQLAAEYEIPRPVALSDLRQQLGVFFHAGLIRFQV